MLDKEFKKIVLEVKNQIRNTQFEIMKHANKQLLDLYFNLGKIISENFVWGNKFIDNLSIELKLEFPNMKGFSARNLSSMKRFYEEYRDYEKVPSVVAQLPWSHNMLIIDKVKEKNTKQWYMEHATTNGWSYSILEIHIKNKLYERQSIKSKLNNFKSALIRRQSDLANEIQKDPYIFDITTLKKGYAERELETAMTERIKNVLIELGTGFSFVGSQYKITVGNDDYFIDMLFYHLKLRCYIVVELKVNAFKPEHAGKLNFYLSVVDKVLKRKQDNPTIGLILCQEKDKFTVEYALKDINKPIGVSSYEVNRLLPKEVIENLPTENDINLHINTEDK